MQRSPVPRVVRHGHWTARRKPGAGPASSPGGRDRGHFQDRGHPSVNLPSARSGAKGDEWCPAATLHLASPSAGHAQSDIKRARLRLGPCSGKSDGRRGARRPPPPQPASWPPGCSRREAPARATRTRERRGSPPPACRGCAPSGRARAGVGGGR
eukprot:scaffold620_cov386-Prasinococcus_capsulatus_cf.AAC.8